MLHDPVAWDRVDTDFAAQTEALEDEFSRQATLHEAARDSAPEGRAILVDVDSYDLSRPLESFWGVIVFSDCLQCLLSEVAQLSIFHL